MTLRKVIYKYNMQNSKPVQQPFGIYNNSNSNVIYYNAGSSYQQSNSLVRSIGVHEIPLGGIGSLTMKGCGLDYK
jgi:hypothetical protein